MELSQVFSYRGKFITACLVVTATSRLAMRTSQSDLSCWYMPVVYGAIAIAVRSQFEYDILILFLLFQHYLLSVRQAFGS